MTETAELSESEQRLLAREIAADDYERKWPTTSSYGNWAKDAFIAGWNAREQYDQSVSNSSSESD